MHTPAKLLARTCTFACILLTVFACSDDEFLKSGQNKTEDKDNTVFDFSTAQDVDLIVDYSDFKANIPVFFSVYNRDPFIKLDNEPLPTVILDENIKPLFSGYTDKNGKFDETITLPTYAKVLHIVTGNFRIGQRRNPVTITDGKATVVVKDELKEERNSRTNKKNAPRYASGTSVPTTDLSEMKNLYCSFDGVQYYKEWVTPLGTWSSTSGRPNYLLDKTDQELIDKGLVFTEEGFNGLYATACAALNSGTDMKETYRQASDMTISHDSEVSITALGSSTCWNSSLGYYYYTGDAPTDKMDLNIIMLFPNTQDGEWPRGSYPNNKYNGNIGTLRGDVVQLMYYPPKGDGSLDLEHGTTIFPAGTKIGFILKCNSWGARGSDYAVNGDSYAKKKNIWASTTDGMSTALDGGKEPNPNGEARSAKFAYTAPNGNKYVVVSFEDACDDKDYDDLMFALNPANAFDFGDEAQIESRKSYDWDVWAFEDLWPSVGDYDMNDAVIEVRREMEYYAHAEGNEMLSTESLNLTTYHNDETRENGLGVKLTFVSGFSTTNDLATIYVKKILPGETEPVPVAKYMNSGNKYYYMPEFTKLDNNVYLLTDDIDKELGATYVFEITYSKARAASAVNVKPFIYRPANSKDNPNNFRWEVHIPYDQPVDKGNEELYGSKPQEISTSKNPYLRTGLYPYGFQMKGVDISKFKNTILNPNNEGKPMDTFFPQFIDWSKSKGSKNPEWYLNPSE